MEIYFEVYLIFVSEVKVTQSCPTLCDPIDYTVHGILQARIMEWAAFPFSRKSSNPRTEPRSPALQADSLSAEPYYNGSLHSHKTDDFAVFMGTERSSQCTKSKMQVVEQE